MRVVFKNTVIPGGRNAQLVMAAIVQRVLRTVKLELPRPGYRGRMRIYFAAMYPITLHLVVSALLCIGLLGLLGRVHKVKAPSLDVVSILGIWSIFAVKLMIRLMDELKDKETDFKFFPDRPLPSGKVQESDITFTLWIVIAQYLAVNLWVGRAFWMAVIVLGYACLMFKKFYIPDLLDRSLLLTVATHNPLIPIMLVYMFTLFSIQSGIPLRTLNWPAALAIIVMYWAMFFSQEVARKIRAQEDENAYVTYSQLWGPRGAVAIAGGAETITCALGLYFSWSLSLSPVFLTLLATGWAVALWANIRFAFSPIRANAKLAPFADAFILCVLVGLGVEFTVLPNLRGG